MYFYRVEFFDNSASDYIERMASDMARKTLHQSFSLSQSPKSIRIGERVVAMDELLGSESPYAHSRANYGV